MYGSFSQDAVVRLYALQRGIFGFQSAHGCLPASLDDFVPVGAPSEVDLRYDPWNRKVFFRVAGDSYEFRSTGEDGAECS